MPPLALVAALVLFAGLVGYAASAPETAPRVTDGARLYGEYCASCHGLSGNGDGPDAAAYAAPPRNLREGFLKQYPTEDLVRRVRDGRPLELALDLPALKKQATEVEALVTYLKRLPGINWTLAAPGDQVYTDHCALWHGMYGKPPEDLPAGVRRPRDLSSSSFQGSVGEKDLITLVRHGRKGMPGLTPRIAKDDAHALAAFVRLLSPGFELYSRYCTACHGDDGRGSGSLAEEFQRPAVVFDRAYFAHRDAEELRASIWHMAAEEKPTMPHYRTLLDATQAAAIIEYLKRSE